jgi:hypothetical protein
VDSPSLVSRTSRNSAIPLWSIAGLEYLGYRGDLVRPTIKMSDPPDGRAGGKKGTGSSFRCPSSSSQWTTPRHRLTQVSAFFRLIEPEETITLTQPL